MTRILFPPSFFGLGRFSPGLCDDHLAEGILEPRSVPVNSESIRFLQCTVPTTSKFSGVGTSMISGIVNFRKSKHHDSYVAYELSH